jgi:hypothetical protein
MTQCYRCGRIATPEHDATAKQTPSGTICRFCQSETEDRCLVAAGPVTFGLRSRRDSPRESTTPSANFTV